MANDDGDPRELILKPVGVVRSDIKTPIPPASDGDEDPERLGVVREYLGKVRTGMSKLVIDPAYEGILDGVEGFSHVMVLYWPHLIPAERRGLRRVHPMGRKDIEKKGIFATCSPARPNPVLVSAVRLLAREENVLYVKGFEALDGSPIIDIKPYVESYYAVDDLVIPEWMQKVHDDIDEAETVSVSR